MLTAASHRRLHTPPRVDREVIISCIDIHGQDYSESWLEIAMQDI